MVKNLEISAQASRYLPSARLKHQTWTPEKQMVGKAVVERCKYNIEIYTYVYIYICVAF